MMGSPTPLDHVTDGSGPGVVLIHGTGADATANWATLTQTLRDRFTVVAPNLPGAGATPAPTAPLTLDELADRVVATAHANGLARFHVVGHSLGAVIATVVAARHRASVGSLVAHAGWLHTGAREAFMFDTWRRLLHADTALLARHLVLTAMAPETLAQRDQTGLAELADGFTALLARPILPQIDLDAHVDVRELAGHVDVPTLVLGSAQDRIIPPHHQRDLARAIPGARHIEVPGGHALPFEDPHRFAALIAEFLDAQQPLDARVSA